MDANNHINNALLWEEPTELAEPLLLLHMCGVVCYSYNMKNSVISRELLRKQASHVDDISGSKIRRNVVNFKINDRSIEVLLEVCLAFKSQNSVDQCWWGGNQICLITTS